MRATRALPSPEGPGDDGAVLPDGQVVTVDALVDGVHWDARLSLEDVGWKAVAVSVSDLAAMGARPAWMVIAVSLPDPAAAGPIAAGVGAACARWGVALVGGDTTRAPVAVVTVTMVGRAVAAPLLRSGARPGDALWATGTPGLAGAGWRLADPPTAALAALRRPQPPLEFALGLAAGGLASAAMDLSDGLAADLARLCAASGVGCELDGDAVIAALPGVPDALACALGGGDDYELLFTAPAANDDAIAAIAAATGTVARRIGRITDGAALVRVGGRAAPLAGPTFEHWGAA